MPRFGITITVGQARCIGTLAAHYVQGTHSLDDSLVLIQPGPTSEKGESLDVTFNSNRVDSHRSRIYDSGGHISIDHHEEG